MPGVRPFSGSSSTLIRNGTGAGGGESSGSQEALYSHGSKTDTLYRSSPDLSRGSSYHQRTSSADSLDGGGSTGSYHGGHSRQSSDSVENYPTRSLSTSSRKTSVSTDPLQFVKLRGADHLAKQAEEQIRLAEQFKKERSLKELEEEKVEAKVEPVDEGDWQSNLSNWKNRRKSRSERSVSVREELDEKLRAEEAKERPTGTIKTFSQMKEERERRKSGYTSYPLNDEGDEDVFKAISTPGVFTTPRSRRVAPAVVPTESTPVEDKKVQKAQKKGVAAWAMDSDEEEDESSGDNEEEEEDKNNNKNQSSSSAQAARQTASSSTTTPSSTSLSSPSEEHSDEPGGTTGIRSRDKEDEESSIPSIRSRRTGLVNRYSSSSSTTTATNNGREGGTTITTTTTSSSFTVEGGVAGRSGRGSAAGHAPNDGSEGAGGRGQGKITDIRKQFETRRQEATSGLSRTAGDSGVHSVDVRSRTKSFERPPLEDAPPPTRPSRTSLGQGGPGSSRVGDRKDESNHSFSSFSSSSSTTTYPSSRHSSRDPVEKVIKISQNPNSEKGFGFTLTGGAEKRQPLVVERVSLGSAADVCELKVRDELISVNRRDVTKMTHPEVTQLISESVRSGQLELRVKRNLDSSKDEEEDFLSSDEEMEKLDRNDVGNAHSFDSMDSKEAGEEAEDQELARERHWMQTQPPASAAPAARVEDSKPSPARPHGPVAHLLEQDEAEVEEEVITPASAPARQQTLPTASSRSSSLAQAENKPVFEVETRPSITLRKASLEAAAAPKPRDAEPAAGRDRPEPRRPRATEAAPDHSNSDDSGPPSILLKWQMKRAGQSGGGLGRKEDTSSSLLGSSLAWRPESASPSSEDTVGGRQEEVEESSLRRADRDLEQSLQKAPVPGPRHTFAFDTSKDHQRMREWDRNQARERRTDPSENALEADFARDQEQFEEKQRQLQHQYQAEQQRAALAERQKQEEERQILEPELERTRPLEERRKERRARLERQRPEDDQPSSLSSNASLGQQGRSSQDTITVPLPHSHQPGGLVIDPRNRMDGRDEAPSFQLNIRKTETPEGLLVRATPPTQLQHSPHGGYEQQEVERLRWEEEEEKRRQLEEKEARIRQEEERLRQEREELRKEQERLRREKEEMERKRMGGTAAAASVDYTDHNGETTSATAFEPVSSRVRAGPLSARLTRPPVQRYGQQPPSPTASSQFSTTVVIDPKASQAYTVSRSPASWNQPEDRTQDVLRPGNISTGLSGSRERLTREDLIAMNRKSTPLQVRPDLPSPTDSSSSGGPPSSPSAPIVREAPNKTQLHSLNVVPKPRLRGADEWITSPRDEDVTDQPSRRHSEVVRRPFAGGISTVHGGVGGGGGAGGGGAGEHWLVEEAERRRLAAATSSDRKPYTGSAGPIKPLPDLAMGPASKWSSDPSRRQSVPAMMAGGPGGHPGGGDHRNMPAQIRQTLLQKTAGARAPGTYPQQQELNAPPGGYSSPNRGSPALQPRGDYGGGGYEGQQQGGPLPPAGRAPPPPKEQALPVSGKQKCSHCSLELGFGAAMVIESLGLYYHVQCFRCCVCRTALGSGVEGTDVRVRVDKLHCPNCYSNDEGSAHRGPP